MDFFFELVLQSYECGTFLLTNENMLCCLNFNLLLLLLIRATSPSFINTLRDSLMNCVRSMIKARRITFSCRLESYKILNYLVPEFEQMRFHR
jgi:hypothetical protein